MSIPVMQKLRAVAIAACQKIHKNRYKALKWPERGFDSSGQRDWHKVPGSFLDEKLAEEARELQKAANNAEDKVTLENMLECLYEAGDVTALAMMTIDQLGALNDLLPPKVVCLCGSTRFKEEFLQAQYDETMKGNIVLTVGFWHHAEAGVTRPSLNNEQKALLDELHKRKIDLSDEIFVLNVDGYVGDSTHSEIQYAEDAGKGIRYLQIPNN